ncbi:MAG: VacJ family lipoprotein [Dyella sp.]
MPQPFEPLGRLLPLAAVVLLAGCAIAKPRTDDPLENFNRHVYAFNNSLDKAVIRPVAVGYRKVTNPPVRNAINNFYSNIKLPITIGNDLLQAQPKRAVINTGRFVVNLTIGFLGFFDPASRMGMAENSTDFGVTLARWGLPEGDFLMLPFVGPTTVRDIWALPVDSYLFDPLSYYSRNHDFKDGQYYLPSALYLVTLRANAIDAESFLDSAFDPYVFLRDAYRQRRLYKIYYGNPPASVINQQQGLDEQGFDPEQLLDQQHQWEHQQKNGGDGQTAAPAAGAAVTAPASSTAAPAAMP